MAQSIERTKLKNGVTVVTDKMPTVRSVSLGFFCKNGARNEPDRYAGITHFIEHTVFKGTKKRSALEIAIEQERLGGNLDAFTTHEETGFVIKVIDERMSSAFDLIGDMLTSPIFAENDLISEQKVIIEEMKMVEDSPEELLGDIFAEKYFISHPLGRNIAGSPKTVRSFDSKTAAKYHASAFAPHNIIVVAAGNIDHDSVVKLAEQYFDIDRSADMTLPDAPPKTAAPIIIKQRKDLEQAHLVLAMPLVQADDERRYAADLLTKILGEGTSSRLWQKIREERGLAYSVGTSLALYKDCGVISVYAGTSPEQTGEVIDIAVEELRKAVKDGVKTQELELAKEQTRASVLLSLEDSAARAGALAHSEMVHHRNITFEETLANVEAVTIDDLNALMSEFFLAEKIAFAALGDLKKLKVDRERLAI